jgi:hypothetical protein
MVSYKVKDMTRIEELPLFKRIWLALFAEEKTATYVTSKPMSLRQITYKMYSSAPILIRDEPVR